MHLVTKNVESKLEKSLIDLAIRTTTNVLAKLSGIRRNTPT